MNCFSIGRTETSAYIQSFEYVPSTGIPKFSLVIENDFTYKAFHHGVKCNIATLSANRICSLNKWSRIQESVRFLKDKQVSNKKIVLAEHVAALGCTKVGEKKYEPATLVRAFEYFALSRTSCQLRDDFELPSISTLTRLTSAIKNLDDNDYLYNMFFCLRDVRKKNCILLLDEVYGKSTLQYHGGTVFRKTGNNP